MNLEKLKNLKEKTEKVIENSRKYLMPTYSRIPVVPEKGEGVRVWDKEGKCYIDLVSGIGVMAVGYSHPRICKVIKEQSQKLVHCSNLYHIENQAKLAEKLCQISFADKVFFCNSGAEANEAAIKLARKFGYQKGAFEIVAMENSFHGRTLATLGLTGQEKYRKWFGPFPPGFKFCEFNNVKKLKEMITSKTCAIIMEPIQGEGGIKEASPEFIEAAREICTEKDILLIFDEVQCGLGRTGKWFAYQHFGVEPDIMTLAKPLAAGLPIGACLAKKNIADIFSCSSGGPEHYGRGKACGKGKRGGKILQGKAFILKGKISFYKGGKRKRAYAGNGT